MFCPEESNALSSSSHRTCLLGRGRRTCVHHYPQLLQRSGQNLCQLGGTPFVNYGVFAHWRFRGNAHSCCPKGPSTLRRNEGEPRGLGCERTFYQECMVTILTLTFSYFPNPHAKFVSVFLTSN